MGGEVQADGQKDEGGRTNIDRYEIVQLLKFTFSNSCNTL